MQINTPLTRADAEKHRYDKTSINPRGTEYNPRYCAAEVRHRSGWHYYQCLRSPGHGPDGLYCAQHAKKVEARVTK